MVFMQLFVMQVIQRSGTFVYKQLLFLKRKKTAWAPRRKIICFLFLLAWICKSSWSGLDHIFRTYTLVYHTARNAAGRWAVREFLHLLNKVTFNWSQRICWEEIKKKKVLVKTNLGSRFVWSSLSISKHQFVNSALCFTLNINGRNHLRHHTN